MLFMMPSPGFGHKLVAVAEQARAGTRNSMRMGPAVHGWRSPRRLPIFVDDRARMLGGTRNEPLMGSQSTPSISLKTTTAG